MIGWIAQLLRGIPRDALGPPGPHPNESPLVAPSSQDPGALDEPWDHVVVPRGMREALRRYGDPGRNGGSPDKSWERTNMVIARNLPGTWNNNPSGRCRLYVHRLVEPHLREALARLERAGLIDEVRTLGCFTFRRIRHGKTGPLSYHSFGAAVDINAAENFGVNHASVHRDSRNRPVSKPFLGNWSEVWPNGVSPGLVRAFENTGWEWGGRWSSFVDPMHFQLVKTK